MKSGYIALILIIMYSNILAQDWSEMQKILAYDGSSEDYFGISVSIDGDYAVIGASEDDDNGIGSGSAYIFQRSGITWIEQAKLTASDGSVNDGFGSSASLSGDYVVIGAYHDDNVNGSAYIFHRNESTWTEQAKLIASDITGGCFGWSVSIDGDYVVIGAPRDNNGSWTGSAYIFQRNENTWIEQTKLTTSNAVAFDYFGISVYISGDYAVIGAPGNVNAGSNCGLAYVFKRNETTWMEQAILMPSDGEDYDYFGQSVSIDGDYVIIGAPGSQYYEPSTGSAYIFQRIGTTWIEQEKLTASDGEDYDFFGKSISIDEDYVVIGAWGDNDNGFASGSAYIFQKYGVTWIEQSKLIASDSEPDDYFGNSVSINGIYVLIGAPEDDGYNPGSVYIFHNENVSFKEEQLNLLDKALLLRNYPNPFNPTTTILFSVKHNSDFITLEIYNIKGQKIKTLANNEFTKGSHSINWNSDDESNKPVSSGVYLYNLKVNGKLEAVKKCLLIK